MDTDNTVISPFRERVFQTLSFTEPDFCPYYIWVDPEMEKPIADHYNDPCFRKTIIQDHVVALIERFVNQKTEDYYDTGSRTYRAMR